jgi:hypothetical protein
MAASLSALRTPHKPNTDGLRLVAAHEAGHAVAYLGAFKDMGFHWPAFDRILIRPDTSKPHVDLKGREVQCWGMVEGNDIYSQVEGKGLWEHLPQWRPMIKKRMEWDIIVNLAGPFGEAAARGDRTKTHMRYTALFFCGGNADYRRAEDVLKDYKWATGERIGLRRFEDRARELILMEWPTIEALSAALLKSDVLSYEQVL